MNRSVDKALESLELFREETNLMFQIDSNEPATKRDLAELSRHTYYVLSSICEALNDISKTK